MRRLLLVPGAALDGPKIGFVLAVGGNLGPAGVADAWTLWRLLTELIGERNRG